jgi:hypothetical protein
MGPRHQQQGHEEAHGSVHFLPGVALCTYLLRKKFMAPKHIAPKRATCVLVAVAQRLSGVCELHRRGAGLSSAAAVRRQLHASARVQAGGGGESSPASYSSLPTYADVLVFPSLLPPTMWTHHPLMVRM